MRTSALFSVEMGRAKILFCGLRCRWQDGLQPGNPSFLEHITPVEGFPTSVPHLLCVPFKRREALGALGLGEEVLNLHNTPFGTQLFKKYLLLHMATWSWISVAKEKARGKCFCGPILLAGVLLVKSYWCDPVGENVGKSFFATN